jgi:hypothetical protein
MQKSVFSLIAAAAVVGIAAIGIQPHTTVAEPAPTDVRPADMAPQPFNPQMSALMNMIIQPRHAKTGSRRPGENWSLAGYYFKELKAGFGVVGRAIPRWKGLPIPDLIEASVEPTFAVLDFRHQGRRAAPVRRVLCQAHAGLQQLPRHHRPFVRGNQGA